MSSRHHTCPLDDATVRLRSTQPAASGVSATALFPACVSTPKVVISFPVAGLNSYARLAKSRQVCYAWMANNALALRYLPEANFFATDRDTILYGNASWRFKI